MVELIGVQEREKAASRRVDVTVHLKDQMAAAKVGGPRGVSLRSIPFVSQIGIRTRPGTTAARELESVLGLALPSRTGLVTSGKGRFLLWQSPDEFLLISDPAAGAANHSTAQVASLSKAIGDEPGMVVDLSANRVVLDLAGPSAQLVLEKGCAIDLHPHYFTPGTAVQTAIGKVPVIIWKYDTDKFYVLPRASFADYMINWLIDAMQEFAAPEVP